MAGNNRAEQNKTDGAVNPKEKILDREWVRLMLMAREQGMTTDEIRQFLQRAASSKRYDKEYKCSEATL